MLASEAGSHEHSLARQECHELGLMWQPLDQSVDQAGVITTTTNGVTTVWFAPERALTDARPSCCFHGLKEGTPCYAPYPLIVLQTHPERRLPEGFSQPLAPPALWDRERRLHAEQPVAEAYGSLAYYERRKREGLDHDEFGYMIAQTNALCPRTVPA